MKKKHTYIDILDSLSAFLKKLTDEELQDLDSGSVKIKFELIGKNMKKESSVDPIRLENLIKNLKNCNDRECGEVLLNDADIDRLILEEILKTVDYPFTKKDNINKLKEKVIESMIGYRLRSNSIQSS